MMLLFVPVVTWPSTSRRPSRAFASRPFGLARRRKRLEGPEERAESSRLSVTIPRGSPLLRSVIAVLLVLTPFLGAASAQPTEADLEWFEQEVRPLLAKRCLACHGPDRQRSGLRLDHIQTILEGGERGPALVLGDPDASLLVGAVRYDDPDLQMPPTRKLASEDLATLQEWVRRGAPWPDEPPPAANVEAEVFDLAARRAEHWAWQPLMAPQVPGAEPSNDSAAIDAFIRSGLEEAGLEPAPVAEPEVLVRRLSFALRGLPPSPDEVEAFLRDGRPDAWERLVDRWLASPHYGERWGRHWLDLMRYAETHGHEFDYPIPEAWRYRDYVIRAFNADVPYDQFLREHVAGDLLAEPRRHPEEHFNESIIATGFWHFYQAHHGPVDVRADEAERVANQIDVFSKTFLGLTVACARCHDHKFDAISTADYYALSGYLQSSRRQYAYLDPRGRIRSATEAIEPVREEAARVQERLALPGDAADALVVASGRLREAAGLESFDPESYGSVSVSSVPVTAWERALEDSRVHAPDHPLHAWYQLSLEDGFGDDSRLAEALSSWRDSRPIPEPSGDSPPNARPLTTSPPDASPPKDPEVFANGNFEGWTRYGMGFTDEGGWSGDGPRGRLWAATPHSGLLSHRHQGTMRSPTFTITRKHIHYRLAGTKSRGRLIIDGYHMDRYNPLIFKEVLFDVETGGRWIWHDQEGDLERFLGHRAWIELEDDGDGWLAVDQIVFSDEPLGPAPPTVVERSLLAAEGLAAEDRTAEERTAEERAAEVGDAASWTALASSVLEDFGATPEGRSWLLQHDLLTSDPEAAERLEELAWTWRTLSLGVPEAVRVLAMTDGSPEDEYVFIRGNHGSRGPDVARRNLEALGGEQAPPPGSKSVSGRLELADHLLDETNPLPARVMANRVWHHLFGRGIVASTDNLGLLGAEPTHPELLDFIAASLRDDGWSVKRLVRRIVLSDTWRATSEPSSAARESDPENLLLQSQRVRRLEGEAIRDALLTVSGRLDRTLYGPPVPIHLTDFMTGRGRPADSGPLDGDGRRSIYLEVRRNFLDPFLLAFDGPIPATTEDRRTISNVPAQSLALMNDPFVQQQARLCAVRMLCREESPEDRIRYPHRAMFARQPADAEIESLARVPAGAGRGVPGSGGQRAGGRCLGGPGSRGAVHESARATGVAVDAVVEGGAEVDAATELSHHALEVVGQGVANRVPAAHGPELAGHAAGHVDQELHRRRHRLETYVLEVGLTQWGAVRIVVVGILTDRSARVLPTRIDVARYRSGACACDQR